MDNHTSHSNTLLTVLGSIALCAVILVCGAFLFKMSYHFIVNHRASNDKIVNVVSSPASADYQQACDKPSPPPPPQHYVVVPSCGCNNNCGCGCCNNNCGCNPCNNNCGCCNQCGCNNAPPVACPFPQQQPNKPQSMQL